MSEYADLYARLVARCSDCDGECWIGTDATVDRCGYQQVDIYVSGLRDPARGSNSGRRKVYAHLAAWCWVAWGCTSTNELWLAYQEFRESGLELDHECEEPSCRNPAHLNPLTQAEHRAVTRARRGQSVPTNPVVLVDEDEEIPF